MKTEEMMSNRDIQNIFKNACSSLPEDMKLSQEQMRKMEKGFMQISEELQQNISRMLETSSDSGQLSEEAQSQFTEKMMKVLIPYMQNVANSLEKDAKQA